MSFPELGDLLESCGQLRQLSTPAKSLHGSKLVVRSTARPDEIRVVGVGQAVCPRARGRHDRALFEKQDGAARAGKGECVRDRLYSLRISDGVPSAIEDTEANSLLLGYPREEVGAVDPGATDLEMRRAGPAEGTTAEQRSPDVCGAATRARHHPPRRALERCESRGEDTRLVERLQCAIVSSNVQLIPRAAGEGVACVRPDLGHDVERAQQTESATRDRRVADVEMYGDLAAALQVHAARRVEEP